MFKKMVLVGLLCVGGLQANPPEKPIKKRHKISLWFKAIIPSILSYASLEAFIRANRDNSDREQLVNGAKHAQWLPVIVGAYCLNIWMETDLKEWFLKKEEPST